MASMREIFPLHVYPKKSQRNFIKENIRNVKGCSQYNAAQKEIANRSSEQFALKKALSVSFKYSLTDENKSTNVKCNDNLKLPNCSPKIRKQYSNSENNLPMFTRGCRTDIRTIDKRDLPMNCQNCGYSIVRSKITNNIKTGKHKSAALVKSTENKIPEEGTKMKDNHRISHENGVSLKKEMIPANYKIGKVPKYLQERNAKLLRDRQKKASQEKLEELMGLNDPRCPPNHMLMPFKELKNNIEEMESRFNNLVQELNRMPVSNDSYKMRQKSIQIEKELKYLEDRLDLFKTKKVFVKMPH